MEEENLVLHIRVSPDMRSKIDKKIKKSEYSSVSDLVRAALDEFLEPNRQVKQTKRYLIDLIRNDPEVRREFGLEK
jgi:Arc/MetJ-type ribon-helix-helix transcriptional regulator